MGSGIAQLAAVHGLEVWFHDSDAAVLTRAHQSISSRIQRLVSKRKLTKGEGAEAIRNLRIQYFAAFHALFTGVASKEDIDAGMKLGTNHPMGPLELADHIGLDVCLSIMKVLHSGLGDSNYVPCPLLVHYVDAGRLGKKKGNGVYNYSNVLKEIKLGSTLNT